MRVEDLRVDPMIPVIFKLKMTTPLQKLMDAYCNRFGLEEWEIIFMIDGDPIRPTDTCASLDLDEGDCIAVLPHAAHMLMGLQFQTEVARKSEF